MEPLAMTSTNHLLARNTWKLASRLYQAKATSIMTASGGGGSRRADCAPRREIVPVRVDAGPS